MVAVTAADKRIAAFATWPDGASPREIGRRVARNLVPRQHMLIGPDNVIHYAEVCTWYGALTFARVTHDKELLAQLLVERFEPLFANEAHLVPRAINVDNAVFGALPLELYIQLRQPRYLAMGRHLADQQWAPPADAAALTPEMQAVLAAGLSRHTSHPFRTPVMNAKASSMS